ncbi:MAG: O-antigen ligase family protein [Chloroflexota bacterium]
MEIAIFVLVFDTTALTIFDLPKAVFTHAVAWALFGVLLVIGITHGVRVPVSPIFVALYLVLGVAVLTTLTAENKYIALFGDASRYLGLTTHAVLGLIALAMAATLEYPRRAAAIGWTVAAVSIGAAFYAIVQRIGADPVQWTDLNEQARPFSTFGNPDFYGQFLAVVALGSAATLAFAIAGRGSRLAVGVLAIVAVGLMLVVATRGSFVGVATGSVALGLLWLRRARLTRPNLIRFGMVSTLLAVALAIMLVATPLGGRILDISRGVGLRDRQLLYDSAIQMFLDHPVLGVGFENFAVAYPKYQQAEWFELAGVNSTNSSAHNWILHIATTTGTVGLLANLALLGAFAVHVWRRARDPDAPALLVAAVALASFYGSGLVLPGAQSIQWIPWVCFGVALASELRTARAISLLPPLRVPRFAPHAIVVALASVGLIHLGSFQADRYAKAVVVKLTRSEAQDAVRYARLATSTDPGRAAYWNDLGRGQNGIQDFTASRAAYREATIRAPYTAAFWWNLATAEMELAKRNEAGAREAAFEAMRRAIEAGPENPESYDRLARIQFNLGDYRGSVENEKRAIALLSKEPKYYVQAAESARQLRDSGATIEFLQQGVAATDSNEIRLQLAVRLIEAGRRADARQVLRDLLAKDPQNAPARDLLRQLEAVP